MRYGYPQPQPEVGGTATVPPAVMVPVPEKIDSRPPLPAPKPPKKAKPS